MLRVNRRQKNMEKRLLDAFKFKQTKRRALFTRKFPNHLIFGYGIYRMIKTSVSGENAAWKVIDKLVVDWGQKVDSYAGYDIYTLHHLNSLSSSSALDAQNTIINMLGTSSITSTDALVGVRWGHGKV